MLYQMSYVGSAIPIVFILHYPLVDPRGVPGTRPLFVQFLSFSGRFRQISYQIIGFCPKFRGWRPRLGNPASATVTSNNEILCYVCRYPTALAMIASGRVNAKPLVTHHFPLEDAINAFETARTGAGGAIKVIIDCFKK